MSDELRLLALQAGAPREVINELWFNIFCQQFAHLVIAEAEAEMQEIHQRIFELESKV